MKCLGMTVDGKLLCNESVKNVAKKVLTRISGLSPFLGYHSDLSPVIKR
jgi:hypothetical protein